MQGPGPVASIKPVFADCQRGLRRVAGGHPARAARDRIRRRHHADKPHKNLSGSVTGGRRPSGGNGRPLDCKSYPYTFAGTEAEGAAEVAGQDWTWPETWAGLRRTALCARSGCPEQHSSCAPPDRRSGGPRKGCPPARRSAATRAIGGIRRWTPVPATLRCFIRHWAGWQSSGVTAAYGC